MHKHSYEERAITKIVTFHKSNNFSIPLTQQTKRTYNVNISIPKFLHSISNNVTHNAHINRPSNINNKMSIKILNVYFK